MLRFRFTQLTLDSADSRVKLGAARNRLVKHGRQESSAMFIRHYTDIALRVRHCIGEDDSNSEHIIVW